MSRAAKSLRPRGWRQGGDKTQVCAAGTPACDGARLWITCSVVSDSVTPGTAACQASLSLTLSQSLLNSCPSNQMQRADSFEKTLMLGKLKAGGEGNDRG